MFEHTHTRTHARTVATTNEEEMTTTTSEKKKKSPEWVNELYIAVRNAPSPPSPSPPFFAATEDEEKKSTSSSERFNDDDKDEILSQAFGEAVFSKMGGRYWQRLSKCNDEDPDFDGHDFIKKQVILSHTILSAPMDYRTYTATFCYNVRETVYYGSRTGILEDCMDNATSHFNPFLFIVAETLGWDIEDELENLVTSSFYIPGETWGKLEDDDEEEEEED